MANVIKPKRRSADATAPTAAQLQEGEIGISVPGKTIYVKDGGNVLAIANLSTPGAGNGFDADKLDNQEGSFYQNSSNQNAGTLPDARLSSNVALKNQHLAGVNISSKAPVLSNWALDLHPESGTVVLPYIANDLAYLTSRGGAVTTNHPDHPNGRAEWFDGAPTYGSLVVATMPDPLVITVNFPAALMWGTKIGISFGAVNFGAKNITLEVYDIAAAGWVTVNTTVDWGSGLWVVTASGGAGGINALRFTLSNWASSQCRIADIFALNYNSALLKTVFVGRDGGDLYGTLKFNSLAASRVLELDASKNVVSVAKATGYNLPLGTTAGTVADGGVTQTALNGKENSFSKGSLIQGTGVTLTGTLANRLVGAGDITISAAGTGTGTVTSVGLSVPAGFAAGGSPVTSSGTLSITYAAGYQGYTSTEATKLNGIAEGAQVNVNADWNAVGGDAQILNKPTTWAWSAISGKPTTFATSGMTLAASDVPTLNQNTTGSAATLTTARTLTIGATGKTFNGSANVAWSLAEIGAAAAIHTHAIGDVTGLQAALDGKVNTGGAFADAFTVTPLYYNGSTNVIDCNNLAEGTRALVSGGGTNANYPGTGFWHIETVRGYTSGTKIQRAWSYAQAGRNATRNYNGTAWTAWVLDWNSGNFDPGTKANVAGQAFTGAVGVQPAGSGAVWLNGGSASLPGYVSFHTPDGTRRGYIGWGSGSNIAFTAENGWGFDFNVAPKVAGQPVWHGGSFNPATKLDARANLSTIAETISDWNAATYNGWYMASGAANAPAAGGAWYMGRVTQHNANWIQQELWMFTDGPATTHYKRHMQNGVWSAWVSDANLIVSTTDPGAVGAGVVWVKPV